MTNVQFSMRVSEKLKSGLEAMSQATHRSQSYLAAKAIDEYVSRNAWKMQALQEAKQKVKKGVFTSQAAIEYWLDSWGTKNEKPMPESDLFPKKPE